MKMTVFGYGRYEVCNHGEGMVIVVVVAGRRGEGTGTVGGSNGVVWGREFMCCWNYVVCFSSSGVRII